jgi:hypothetical protein
MQWTQERDSRGHEMDATRREPPERRPGEPGRKGGSGEQKESRAHHLTHYAWFVLLAALASLRNARAGEGLASPSRLCPVVVSLSLRDRDGRGARLGRGEGP